MKVLSIVGRLGRDPELRQVGSGDPVLNLNVAVDDRVKRGDEWVNETLWIGVTLFGKRGESLSRVLTKGTRVACSGEPRLREFEGRDGKPRTVLELIARDVEPLFDRRQEGDPRPAADRAREQHRDDFKARRPASSGGNYGIDEHDDLPF